MSETMTFSCPLCGARFQHPRAASLVGKKVRCGKCNQVFILKDPELPQREAQGATTTQARSAATPAPADPGRAGDAGGRQERVGHREPDVVGGHGVAVATATEPATPSPAAARSKTPYIVLAVAVAAILGGVLYHVIGRSSGSAVATVRAYLAADSWRDRLAYVLEPEAVKPLMEAYYTGSPWKVPKFEILTSQEPEASEAGWVTVEADVNGNPTDYYLRKTSRGYRIDWKMSAAINDISIEEFRATRPTTPTRLRAYAELGDSFLDDYADLHDSAWSIYLMESNGWSLIATGYAMKHTPVGDQLFAALKDGKKHRVVVDVQCRPGSESGKQCMISKVLRIDSWLLENDQLAQGANPAKSTVNATRPPAGPKAPDGNANVPPAMSLADAVYKNDIEQVKRNLRQGADPNGKAKMALGGRLLHEAAGEGYLEVAAALIEAGAEVNGKGDLGETPLYRAASSIDSKDMVALLIKAGAAADCCVTDNIFPTPLWQAVVMKDADTVELLAANGADVNHENKDRLTPLHMAAFLNLRDIAQILVVHGARADAKDASGNTPVSVATSEGHSDLAVAIATGFRSGGTGSTDDRSDPWQVSPDQRRSLEAGLAARWKESTMGTNLGVLRGLEHMGTATAEERQILKDLESTDYGVWVAAVSKIGSDHWYGQVVPELSKRYTTSQLYDMQQNAARFHKPIDAAIGRRAQIHVGSEEILGDAGLDPDKVAKAFGTVEAGAQQLFIAIRMRGGLPKVERMLRDKMGTTEEEASRLAKGVQRTNATKKWRPITNVIIAHRPK